MAKWCINAVRRCGTRHLNGRATLKQVNNTMNEINATLQSPANRAVMATTQIVRSTCRRDGTGQIGSDNNR